MAAAFIGRERRSKRRRKRAYLAYALQLQVDSRDFTKLVTCMWKASGGFTIRRGAAAAAAAAVVFVKFGRACFRGDDLEDGE